MEEAIARKAKGQQGTRTDLLQNLAKSSEPINTREEIAKVADVSGDTIRKVKKVNASAPKFVQDEARKGNLSVNRAYLLTKALEGAAPEVAQVAVQHNVTDPQLVDLMSAKKHTDTVQGVLASGCLQDGETVKPLNEATAWDLQGLLRRRQLICCQLATRYPARSATASRIAAMMVSTTAASATSASTRSQ